MEDTGLIKLLSREILALLLKDKSAMERYGFVMDAEVFDNPIHKLIFKVGRDYFEQYGTIPREETFENEMSLRLEAGEGRHVPEEYFWQEASEVFELSPERDYIQDKIEDWVMRRSLMTISAKAKVLALSQTPSIEEIRKEIQNVNEWKGGGKDLGSFVLRDLDSRRRLEEKPTTVPTGVIELDTVLGGGRAKGTLGVVMAGTGVGKSMTLITFGANAVRARYKTAHITLELSQPSVLQRYESALAQMSRAILIQEESLVKRRLGWVRHVVRPADIVVKEFPAGSMTIEMLRAYLLNLLFWENFEPDMIIIDYADIMKMPEGNDDKWVRQGQLFVELRGLAQELNVAIWTAVQGKKDALSKPLIKLQDMAGAIEKAQVADVIIAVCRTDDEIRAHEGRFFVAKNRDGVDNTTIKFKENFEQSRIQSLSTTRGEVATRHEAGEIVGRELVDVAPPPNETRED